MFTVGHVRTPLAVLEDHRLAGGRVFAEFPKRRLGSSATALLGLGEESQALVKGDGEELLLVVKTAALFVLLQVGAVAAVLDSDLDAVGRVDADGPGQAKNLAVGNFILFVDEELLLPGSSRKVSLRPNPNVTM